MAGIVKFGVNQSRGAAGQSTFGPKRGYNFANLYQQNKSGQQIKQKAAGFQEQANATQQDMSDAVNAIKRPGGNTEQAQGSMANAVNRAKGLSNETQNYSPSVEMTKAGASPYQAGIGSFYAGGNGSAANQKIRKFGGLYQQILGQQSQAQNSLNNGLPQSTVAAPTAAPIGKADQNQAETDAYNKADNVRNVHGAEGDQVNRLSNLDWMLKTGRITTDQYYAAQRDDAAYDNVMLNFNK